MPEPYYIDGSVTIYHGDCRDVLPQLDPVDLVLTDPPYGVNYASNRVAGRGRIPITNDGTRLSLALYRSVIPLLSAEHVLWFTRWDAWPDVWAELGQVFRVRGLLIWDKGHPGIGSNTHWGTSYELIASCGELRLQGKRDGAILRFPPVHPTRRVHPTEKPVELLAYLVAKLAPRTVLDPFMGGGATLVAARIEGRNAIGIEIEERYCEIAARRCAQDVLGFGAAA